MLIDDILTKGDNILIGSYIINFELNNSINIDVSKYNNISELLSYITIVIRYNKLNSLLYNIDSDITYVLDFRNIDLNLNSMYRYIKECYLLLNRFNVSVIYLSPYYKTFNGSGHDYYIILSSLCEFDYRCIIQIDSCGSEVLIEL